MARPLKYDWKNIIIDLEVGMSQAEVHKKYGVPYSSLSNYLKRKPLKVNEQAKNAVEGFSAVSEVVCEVNEQNPDHAQAVINIVTDKFPHFQRAMSKLSDEIFKRSLEITPTADARDLKDIAKSMQTVTDTIGISQRHATKVEKEDSHAEIVADALKFLHERRK